jgi:hypothetical protein
VKIQWYCDSAILRLGTPSTAGTSLVIYALAPTPGGKPIVVISVVIEIAERCHLESQVS